MDVEAHGKHRSVGDRGSGRPRATHEPYPFQAAGIGRVGAPASHPRYVEVAVRLPKSTPVGAGAKRNRQWHDGPLLDTGHFVAEHEQGSAGPI